MLVSAPEVSGMQGVASMTIADGLRYGRKQKRVVSKSSRETTKVICLFNKKIKEDRKVILCST